jgi:Tfp pilus assembly protein PilV
LLLIALALIAMFAIAFLVLGLSKMQAVTNHFRIH